MTTFTNSYMATNRDKSIFSNWDFLDGVQPTGHLSYALADGSYNQSPEAYDTHENVTDASLPPNFSQAIVADLQAAARDSPDRIPRLIVFVHGLATSYSGAIADTTLLGNQLVDPNGDGGDDFVPFSGLVIGYSWPCDGSSWGSGLLYGLMREHINESVAAFANFVTALQSLRAEVPGLILSLVCHSEGNYMAQQGMAGLPQGSGQVFDHVLLMAADLDTNCLESVTNGDAAAAVAASAGDVTVYWNSNDDVLPYSVEFEQSYFVTPSRLGLAGPDDFSAEAGNAPAVDCSEVITADSVSPYGVSTHMGYFYVAQVLDDISQTAAGATVVGRESVSGTNGLGFCLDPKDWSALAGHAHAKVG